MRALLVSALRSIGIRRDSANCWRMRRRAWPHQPRLALAWLQNKLARRTMVGMPEFPDAWSYELRKVTAILGLHWTQDRERFALGIAWKDTTVRDFSFDDIAPEKRAALLNVRCPSIAKDRIEDVFEMVFGYPLRLDPTAHRGPAVKKSKANAAHDGAVIECPVAQPEPGCVYQRLIDNRVAGGLVVDLRTPFYRGTIPLVYLKYRPEATRFADTNARVEIVRPEEVYSAEELRMIREFCRAFGLDYGGLDVLRDQPSGRLYIVDVNATPYGPPVQLPPRETGRACALLAAAFQREFVEK
jgi:hypothetical protein